MNRLVVPLMVLLLICSVSAHAAVPKQTFATPTDAAQALSDAALRADRNALTDIFGSEFIDEISSGDPIEDQIRLKDLAERFKQQHQVVALSDGSRIIEVGAQGWPFPAPLVEHDGRWSFDADRGVEEVLNRRVGENELDAIKAAEFYVEAQRLYHSRDRTGKGASYARKFISSPGKRDGLYWSERDFGPSPFTSVAWRAVQEGYGLQEGERAPMLHGYHYVILDRQGTHAPGGAKSYLSRSGAMTGGFALLAYPARWGVDGVMSFLAGSDGTVYQADLGPDTAKRAASISTFDPGPPWSVVDEQEARPASTSSASSSAPPEAGHGAPADRR